MDQQTLAFSLPTPETGEGSVVLLERGQHDGRDISSSGRAAVPSKPSGEQLLSHFARLVEEMAVGQPHAPSPGRDAAIDALEVEICSASWKTPEGRDLAQELLAQLETVRRRGRRAPGPVAPSS
jgi:hypothetical protein